MSKIIVNPIALSPGMEFSSTSYPGDGVYWLANRNKLAVVSRESCLLVSVDPSLIVEDMESVGVSLSESFVLALIDKVAELVKYQAPREARNTDRKKG